MKTALRVLALLVALGGSGFWFAAGGHTGWSKNQVAVQKKDPVTDLEFTEYEKRFVPGVDFLGGIGLSAAVLLTASIFVRKK
jgi:hypothetical protein